jgi:hypothetical protein
MVTHWHDINFDTTFDTPSLTPSKLPESTDKTVDMSTPTATTSSLMHPSPDLARLMGERHYLCISQSLNDLEHLVERLRAEQYFIYDQLLDAGLVEPRIEPTNQQQTTRRYRYHPYNRSMTPSSSRRTPSESSHNMGVEIQSHRQSLNDDPSHMDSSSRLPTNCKSNVQSNRRWRRTDEELGTRENPIYVLDDDEVRGETMRANSGQESNYRRDPRL